MKNENFEKKNSQKNWKSFFIKFYAKKIGKNIAYRVWFDDNTQKDVKMIDMKNFMVKLQSQKMRKPMKEIYLTKSPTGLVTFGTVGGDEI